MRGECGLKELMLLAKINVYSLASKVLGIHGGVNGTQLSWIYPMRTGKEPERRVHVLVGRR